MSEPWPPAFMRTAAADRSRHPHGPLEAGEPGRHGPAGHHGQGGRAPGPTPWRAVDVDRRRSASPSTTASPANPASATSRFEPLPTTSTSTPGGRHRVGDRGQVGLVLHPGQEGRRPADPVGGERAERHVGRGEGTEPPGRLDQDGTLAHRCGPPSGVEDPVGDGREVSGPEGEAEVAGSQGGAEVGDRVVERRDPGHLAPRVGVEDGVDDQLAGDARAGGLPGRVDVGDRQHVGAVEGVGEGRATAPPCGCSGGAGSSTPPAARDRSRAAASAAATSAGRWS